MGKAIFGRNDPRRVFNCTKHISAYRVIYRPFDDGIEVLQVLQGSRDFPTTIRAATP